MLQKPTLKLQPENEGNNNGGNPPQDSTQTPPQTPPTETKGNDTLDEFGYPKIVEAPPAQAAKPADKPAEQTPPQDEKGKESEVKVPGYNDEPPAEPKKEEAPPAEPKKEEAPPAELGYKIEVADLPVEEIKIVEDLAKAHKLTKEQAQAVAEMRKLDIDALQKVEEKRLEDLKTKTANLRSGWKRELESDPKFGGANFAHSLKQAGTVLEKFFPNTKKMLDDNKGMLPPSVMRDLQALHKTLFATEPLVEGEKVADNKSKDVWDMMY